MTTLPAARIRIQQLVEAQQHAAEPPHLCAQCNAVDTQLAALEAGLEQVVKHPHRTTATPPLVCEP